VLSPDTHSAAEVIRLLALEPLPHEGGWFRRVAESEIGQSAEGSPHRAWSSGYALFTPEGFSALHRLTSDEVWCFQAGDPLDSLRLFPDGRGERISLGLNPGAAQRSQDILRAGTWQGARLQPGGRWALVSCVVVPEFTWDGFQLGRRAELVRGYPKWEKEIEALTRIESP
jgi:predicted cupin superfamily sugar epimerase